VADEVFHDLVFAGLLAFSDPVRPDVPASIEKAQMAGARVVMLTGDHPETAVYIAKEAGINGAWRGAVLGSQIEEMGDEELLKTLEEKSVFARMLPTAKLRIANLLKEQGEVVAMTGDGVNDAPALKHANIGVAVGSGTAVAQEASDLILLDNSFSIIVSAIEEGRRIIDNLKKVVSHLLSTNFSEAFVITGAIALGLPLPLLATQILWVNIIGGGLLNFAFAFEPKEEGILNRNPRSEELKTVFTKSIKKLIFLVGMVTGLIALALFLILVAIGLPIEEIRTIIFVALSIDIMFIAFSLKNLHRPVWKTNLFSNRFLLLSLAISFALLMLTLTVPFLQKVFEIVPLSALDLLILIGVGFSNLVTVEAAKYFIMYKKQKA
jgi:Ca2+-transporting ATPase